MRFSIEVEHAITIENDGIILNGILYIPQNAVGIVLFAHGSGSSRFSVRNQFVAHALNKAQLATLLFDLLTPEEEALDLRTREFRFNIHFLANRLIDATNWCSEQNFNLHLGYFGASTGAAAALIAAANKKELIKAVVSRGGRPDLAQESLADVKAPTLLIVGSHDEIVITMNESAFSELKCIKQLEIVSGATHLFEEPGTLGEVARLAKDWFVQYLHNS
ncbi:dienelactone hydrolase family protein [Legionella cardiaca]|uniref:Dienelactone hydrolase family protein n=1 Tax=Legionella cardiaca TaxID=1071983 RepID=A0ABY8AVF0_9GAMM|nr:dienelactone hydrolase family protein [Legionella cardiaca]WED44458.1 dienelactone hydrolase family protein [Legionella cardiaca]